MTSSHGSPGRARKPLVGRVLMLRTPYKGDAGTPLDYLHMHNQLLPSEVSEETTRPLTLSAGLLTTDTIPTAESLMTETEQTLPTTQDVTDLLAHTQRKLRRRKHLLWASLATFNVMPIVDWCSWIIPGYEEWRGAHLFLWGLVLLGPMAPLFVFMTVCARTTKIDANELMRLGGKSALPALLDVLIASVPKQDNKTYINALAILLPQLQSTDAHLLTPRHRCKLNTLLKSNRMGDAWVNANQELIVPLLKAYEQVGDADALPLVERLADRSAHNNSQRQIQQAAQACLPLLRMNFGSLIPKQTLLRAATLDTAGPDVLLRPTAPTSPMSDTQLLRATSLDDVVTTS